jgi:hypothetical protein
VVSITDYLFKECRKENKKIKKQSVCSNINKKKTAKREKSKKNK